MYGLAPKKSLCLGVSLRSLVCMSNFSKYTLSYLAIPRLFTTLPDHFKITIKRCAIFLLRLMCIISTKELLKHAARPEFQAYFKPVLFDVGWESWHWCRGRNCFFNILVKIDIG